MKTRKIFVGLALVCGLAVSSCSKYQTDMPKEREDIILTKTQQAVLDKGNGFAIDLFREMCAENGYENLFISPLSATLALSAVTNGAAGQTMEDMKAALGFGSFNLEDMNVFYKTLIPALKDVDNTVKLQIANAAWIKQGFAVETPFINALTNYYDASVRELDFSSPSAVEAINQWCADNTNNLIKEIINEIDPNARMFYTNALYYKGQWTNKFKKEDNYKGPFTCYDKTLAEATYMRQTSGLNCYKAQDVAIAEFPYGNEAFSMVVVLPDEGVSVFDVASRLTLDEWNGWLSALSKREVEVQFPKFKVEYDTEDKLFPVLSRMGMGVAFDPDRADFSNISKLEDLYIALIKQKAYVEVDEQGTEAAAVTIIGFNITSAGPGNTFAFHMNRPFLYFIREKSTGAILFSGLMSKMP